MLQRIICILLLCSSLAAGTFYPRTVFADGEIDFLDDAFYEEETEEINIYDPLEPFNRLMFEFNDVTYTWVFDPVATAYTKIMPYDFRLMIDNFFYNLQEPVRLINAVLQGRFEDSSILLARFIINTIGGVGGLGDPAEMEFNLERLEATLGQTFSTWGIGDGFYLVVPLYGASTLRDFTGTVIDGLALTPYYLWTDDWMVRAGIYFSKETNMLSFRLGQYEDLKKLSFDPYIALRNGYIQHRRQLRKMPLDTEN